ncbi:hormone-sensitive lipase isoform X1 [Hydra vulgaris]|uniref:hormone-sensitive lipase isoform X1 n=1 Tax=Hydra vulgaris TaxID=6087 RepID=UPI001F5E46D2|nr:hormone-sensitive lipase-like [Hydra vulgaris]
MTKNNLVALFQYRGFLSNAYCSSFKKIKLVSKVSKMNYSSGGSDNSRFISLFNNINVIATDNADFFCGKTSNRNVEFCESFDRILNVLNPLQISLEVITRSCDKFDISPSCKGNGYRSIANVVESCLSKVLELNEQIKNEREKFFFRSYHTYMELNSYSQVLMRLLSIVQFAIILLEESNSGCLFPKEEKIDENVMADFEKINRECFYGRSFGFQYVESLKKPLRFVGVVMAAYSDGYSRHDHSLSRALSSVIHSGKYYINPELRAKRITELTQKSNVSFCKAFWSLTENYGVQHAPLLLCPAMAVNTELSIPNDPINIKTLDNKTIEIVLPSLNGKVVNVRARLLSYVWREGQVHEVNNSKSMLGAKPAPPSRYLMFHAHGGGFVAQSSKSHEIYLRYWAKTLNIPILSIDYSLSPGAPFPQALNEIYFAYAWALENLSKLGSTGEKIVFAGDSAGANLVTAVALKVIEGNFRLPDSIVLAYPPMRLQYLPSPSRILSLMDPLLPIGVLKTCISAYTGDVIKDSYELVNSSFYGETFNPYDLDIGDSLDECDMSYRRAFSENDMAKLKHSNKNDFDDNERFYSDFSYSDSSSTSNDFSLVNDFSLSDSSIDENKAPSLLRSFTSSFSSRVKLMTLNMTTYLYGADSVESNANKSDCSTNSLNISKGKRKSYEFQASFKNELFNVQKNLQDSSIKELPLESMKFAKSFSICKECLHRSENCICLCLIPKVRLKKTDKYRSSCHYRNRSLSCCNEKIINPKINNLSHSASSLLEEKIFDNDDNAELLSQSENSCGLEMRPCDTSSNNIQSNLGYLKNSPVPNVHSSFMSATSASFELGKNPYLSPYLASDSLLKKLPPVTIVASALDPLFDDSVEFVRKMKSLNKSAELCIVDKLPHGFLNFQAFSNEAKEASDMIINCVKKSLNMGIRVNDSSMNLKFDEKQ